MIASEINNANDFSTSSNFNQLFTVLRAIIFNAVNHRGSGVFS